MEPILLLTNMNDLQEGVTCKILEFADDTKRSKIKGNRDK